MPASTARAMTEILSQERARITALETALDQSSNYIMTQAQQIDKLKGVITDTLHLEMPEGFNEGDMSPSEMSPGTSAGVMSARTSMGGNSPKSPGSLGGKSRNVSASYPSNLRADGILEGPNRPSTASTGSVSPVRASSARRRSMNSVFASLNKGASSSSRPSTASPTPSTADVLIGSSSRRSPPLGVPKRRPTSAGGMGMRALLKQDVESWRAK